MSRAPRRPDGWEGPEDGVPKALRLVEPPDVQPRGARLFPFPAALAIAGCAMAALAVAGDRVWFRQALAGPVESTRVMVIESVVTGRPERSGPPVRLARPAGDLPRPPLGRRTFRLPDGPRPVLPRPVVRVSTVPFEVPEVWNAGAAP